MMTKAIIGIIALLVVIPATMATTYIIDDADPEFFTGNNDWITVQHPNAYGGEAHYIIPAGNSYWTSWQASWILPTNRYDIYVWKFEHEYNSVVTRCAVYTVFHAEGETGPICVDQTTPGNEWVYLGRYNIDRLGLQGVLLTTPRPGIHIADAMKFVSVTEAPVMEENQSDIPTVFSLSSPYPNPFNSSTSFTITLPVPASVSVMAYDLLGREVAIIAQQRFTAGKHQFTFNASDLASGIYFVRATVPGHLDQVQKVVLVR